MTRVQTMAGGLLLWHPDRWSPNGSGTCPVCFNLFLREIVCRPVHPVLPLRREEINIDRILGEPELVRNVGRDDHDVAGVHHIFLALRINVRFSLSNPRDLLVGVVMQRHHGAPGLAHTVPYADLTRISEMKRVAAEVAKAEPRIDVLVNNAGAMFSTHKLTEVGLAS
jgi:hypothetical protein